VPVERAEVVRVLRVHGLNGVAAAEAWTTAQELVRGTRRRGIEHAATLDADNGRPIGPVLTGSASSTDLTPHVTRFAQGRAYVQIHTHPHPLSTSFSDLDMLVLATQPSIRAMVVVGIDGTWYVASRLPTFSTVDRRAIVGDFLEEYRDAEAQGVPNKERTHTALERVASRHGVRYDRVTGLDDG